jgi:hypothetical protein
VFFLGSRCIHRPRRYPNQIIFLLFYFSAVGGEHVAETASCTADGICHDDDGGGDEIETVKTVASPSIASDNRQWDARRKMHHFRHHRILPTMVRTSIANQQRQQPRQQHVHKQTTINVG